MSPAATKKAGKTSPNGETPVAVLDGDTLEAVVSADGADPAL